jgi:hypothetical protein
MAAEVEGTHARPFSSKSGSEPSTSPSFPVGTGEVRPATTASRMPCSRRAVRVATDVSERLGSARLAACELAWIGTEEEEEEACEPGTRREFRRKMHLRRTAKSGSNQQGCQRDRKTRENGEN